MSYDGLVCTSCGARQVVRQNGMFICTFCRANVVPRLEPGAGCNDLSKGILCSKPAEALCTACGRPICEKHHAPKIIYWQAPLFWGNLCSQWDAEAGRLWEKLANPAVRLPVPGIEPASEWIYHDKKAMFEVGQIELEIAEAVKGLADPLGGDFYETGLHFESICSICEAELGQKVPGIVSAFSARYKQAAYVERLRAITADLQQGISYIETCLEGNILEGLSSEADRNEAEQKTPSEGADEGKETFTSLDMKSPKAAWEYYGAEFRQRLDEARKLSVLLGIA